MDERTEKKTPRAEISPALVARARTGDQSAFTELYEQTSPVLYRTVRSMIREEDLVWDILQDSYIRAYQALDKLGSDEAFLPWLRRIAVNETARRMSRPQPLRFSELSGEADEQFQPELPDLSVERQPELALDRKENARLVREILGALPEQQQLILGMRYYEDMRVAEIARLLKLAPGTVKAQLFKGRKKVELEVRALERQGVKLYGLGPFPFLMALLRQLEPTDAAEQQTLAALRSKLLTAGAALTDSAAGIAVEAGASSTVTALTAAQAFFHGLGGRLLAGAAAVLLIGVGIWAGSRMLQQERSTVEIGVFRPTELRMLATDAALTTELAAERSTEAPAPETTEPEKTESEPTPPETEPTDSEALTEATEPETREDDEEQNPLGPVGPADPSNPGGTEDPDNDEPQLPPMTLEESYDYVLEQYRRALTDPNFRGEGDPWINAETVSELSQRWSLYADDENAALSAAYYDIDGNGTPELILIQNGLPEIGWNEGNYAANFPGIYTWNGSGPVELLHRVGCTNDDLVSVYGNGVIRIVENSYYASPAQVVEYQIDPESCALRELDRWTYRCDDQGERSYTNEDGTLTPEQFYRRYDTELGVDYGPAEAFVSNPGTAPEGPVAELEGLPEQNEEEYGIGRLPKITLEGKAYEAFNESILSEIAVPTLSDSERWGIDNFDYDWSQNGDILCVWVTVTRPGGSNRVVKVGRFSLSEGREITEDELLARCGMSRAEYGTGLGASIRGALGLVWDGILYDPRNEPQAVEADERLLRLWSLNEAVLILDRNGSLVCIVPAGALAGGDLYCRTIPVLR